MAKSTELSCRKQTVDSLTSSLTTSSGMVVWDMVMFFK